MSDERSNTPVLTVDIGGSHLKILASGKEDRRKVDSGPAFTPMQAVDAVKSLASDWDYHSMTIGFPGPVTNNRPSQEPVNLGIGWKDFDFEDAFGIPVKVVNDALLQAVGSFEGGKMLFLGLGTGLGSALVIDSVAQPLELAHLPYRRKGRTFEDYVGQRGLDRFGEKKWCRLVFDVVERLKAALQVDYVVIGGGNVRKLKKLPDGSRRGSNDNAFEGGFRLWKQGGISLPGDGGFNKA